MPSSSTGKTSQEGRLIYFYQVAYARLHFSNMKTERDFIQQRFDQMLDLPSNTYECEFWADDKWWDDMERFCDSKRRFENAWAAGIAVANAGACLFEFGRDQEAADCCQWAEELQAWSRQLSEELGG